MWDLQRIAPVLALRARFDDTEPIYFSFGITTPQSVVVRHLPPYEAHRC